MFFGGYKENNFKTLSHLPLFSQQNQGNGIFRNPAHYSILYYLRSGALSLQINNSNDSFGIFRKIPDFDFFNFTNSRCGSLPINKNNDNASFNCFYSNYINYPQINFSNFSSDRTQSNIINKTEPKTITKEGKIEQNRSNEKQQSNKLNETSVAQNLIINENNNLTHKYEKFVSNYIEKPRYYSPEEIKDILKDENLPIKDGKEVDELKYYLLNKKRRRSSEKSKNNKTEKSKNHLGRKEKNKGLIIEHSKNRDKNLMVKYKTFDIPICMDWINSFLGKDEQLLNIDFKIFAKNINVRENIKFNKLPLYKIFSHPISTVYKKVIRNNNGSRNYNLQIMQKYIVDDTKNIKFKNNKEEVINMKLNEYHLIQLHLETDEIRAKYSQKVRDSVPKIEKIIEKIYQKEMKNKDKFATEDQIKEHMNCLLITAYNIDYLLYLKHPRQKRSVTNSKKVPEELKILNNN